MFKFIQRKGNEFLTNFSLISYIWCSSFLSLDGIDDNEIKEKRKFTPLTNPGCESEFASVGNDLKNVVGGTRLKTVSDKRVVRKGEKKEDS